MADSVLNLVLELFHLITHPVCDGIVIPHFADEETEARELA